VIGSSWVGSYIPGSHNYNGFAAIVLKNRKMDITKERSKSALMQISALLQWGRNMKKSFAVLLLFNS